MMMMMGMMMVMMIDDDVDHQDNEAAHGKDDEGDERTSETIKNPKDP